MVVLDVSAALTRVLLSQSSPAADAFFAGELPSLAAPAVFAFELRNALLKAERRGLTSPDLVDEAFALFAELIELRAASGPDLVRLVGLARREALSFFDVAYLDLALREDAAIASRDGALIEAARRRNVTIHDLR